MKSFFILLCVIAGVGLASAQVTVSGTITDTDGQSLPGANIVEKGTTNGITTDIDGRYTITVPSKATLIISFVGYKSAEVEVAGKSVIDVVLKSEELEEVVVVGSRTAPRSSTDTPLPVDVISSKDLSSTGQITFDKALQYRIPSFNTVQTPVNDATSLLDPYEIRNMGPSRTLILINGKRKNLSALLYVQTSPGKGETGADLSAIPTDAIKRVEVLRDGASAQYGSDAIAGVVNVVLKDNARYGSVTLRSKISSAGDGARVGISVNNGSPLGKKGFINYTINFSRLGQMRRSGKVSAGGEYSDFIYQDPASASGSETPEQIRQANIDGRQYVEDFLKRHPDAGNHNSSPAKTTAKFLVNGAVDLTAHVRLYFNAAYVAKKVNSFANYRAPYSRPLSEYPYLDKFFPNPNGRGNYDGYQPTFDGDLTDYNGTVGFLAKRNGWHYDLSFTVGGNQQLYKVRDTHNGSKLRSTAWNDDNGNGILDVGESPGQYLYRENSPISFSPGGAAFNHVVGNMDINKALSDRVSLGFGTEFRAESFEIVAGGKPSYDGGGPDSFAGNRPEDSGIFTRYNIGGYLDVAWDITDNFLVNGTARAEYYSDFGSAFVWKASSRYKFLDDKMTLRASVSTGFRAPTLHQIYTQKLQYNFTPGSGIGVSGIFNNVSPQAQQLGVPRLKAETSTNITAGIGGKFFNRHLSFTVDYYNIAVKDRIVLSSRIGRTDAGGTKLDALLDNFNIVDLSFFSNGINTRTSGLDVVVGYKNIRVGQRGYLSLNLSGNYRIENKQEGTTKEPEVVEEAGKSILGETISALFFTSRPKTKWILGINYEMGKFNVSLYNTLFGKTRFHQLGLTDDLDTEFLPRVLTNLGISFSATKKLTIAANVNNILNVLPKWEFVAKNADGQALLDDQTETYSGLTRKENVSNLITYNGRYPTLTYDGSQFSQFGTMFNLSLNYRF